MAVGLVDLVNKLCNCSQDAILSLPRAQTHHHTIDKYFEIIVTFSGIMRREGLKIAKNADKFSSDFISFLFPGALISQIFEDSAFNASK